MTNAESVTDFNLGDWSTEGADLGELLKAINEFCGSLAEEYNFSLCPSLKYEAHNPKVPAKYWNLVAFAVEGGSEGYYVHVGAILKIERDTKPAFTAPYMDFGFAKTYSAESAYELAKQAQRFLSAARWN